MTSHIEFVNWDERLVPSIPVGRLDSLRWWLVKKLGGQNPFDTVRVTRVPVDGKEFMDRLWKQKRALIETFHRKPTTLLIGGEDYEELMNSPAVWQAFTIHANFNYGRDELYGLTVKVIPWMKGMIVMPNEL